MWLQDPAQAEKYKEAGINLYVALWGAPPRSSSRPSRPRACTLICSQNKVGLAHKDDPTIVGWMHGDEPDNAQEIVDRSTGKRRYGPPIAPARIVADYQQAASRRPHAADHAQPGPGRRQRRVGRAGPGASLDDYPKYVKGADIVSFDVYPVAGLDRPDARGPALVRRQGDRPAQEVDRRTASPSGTASSALTSTTREPRPRPTR